MSTGTDYKNTVLTPKTEFPQRGSLPKREPERLERWAEMKLEEKLAEKRAGAPEFILHDGPPYANGNIHIGHALNKVLKDIITRYRSMAGYRSHYVPGWDCHGLPIEQKVLEELQKKKETGKSAEEIRELCAAYARKWVDIQCEEFIRLGIRGDWENPYLTMNPRFEAAIIRALGELVKRGLVFKGFKPVFWDPVFETALAEAEIEYNENHVSHSIYVRFPLESGTLPGPLMTLEKPSIVIWTTTPWTLPANLGVTVHPDLDYVAYKHNGETFIVAQGLLEHFVKECGLSGGEVVTSFPGRTLDRLECGHPIFPEKKSLLMCGGHVTLETGTGCVHTAPAHGVEDFQIGKEYDLGVFNPVDEKGRYTDLYPEMSGVSVFDANKKIIEKLQNEGTLVHTGEYHHSYPYSWRSHKPVIMRATEQWFMDVGKDGLREAALNEVDTVQWIPNWGADRIRKMVENRPDWCLSRQRSWGVPIPSIRDKEEDRSILTPEICERFAQLAAEEGSDCWFKRPVGDFLPPELQNHAGRYEKEFNILDVWFDSGSSHLAVLEERDDLSWPADLYLEGSDQHRGWFQSSLWVAMGVKNKAPYKAVLTHGFVLDEKKRPMSKSLGNVVSPQKVIDQMGADVLRLWVASEDYRADVSLSDGILSQVSNVYRRIRNTIRFLLGNLADFDPQKDAVPYEDLLEDDKWALSMLHRYTAAANEAYENYEFHRVFHRLNEFCVVELGGVYLDCAKDRLYCSAPDDAIRRACQTVICEIATHLLRLLAPILTFTADEGWEHLPAGAREESVHLADFPKPNSAWKDDALAARWNLLLQVREEVQKAIEPLRAKENKIIGNSLEAIVTLRTADATLLKELRADEALLPRLLIVSAVEIEEGEPGSDAAALNGGTAKVAVGVRASDQPKCERCWVRSSTVGSDNDHPGLCDRCAGAVRRMAT